MRAKLFLSIGMLLTSFLGLSQTTTLIIPSLENEFEIKLEKNSNEGIDALITDSKGGNIIHKLTFGKGASVTSFTTEIYKEINTTTNYYFKTVGIVFMLTKSGTGFPTSDQYATGITTISEADFTKLLKSKTVFNNDTPPSTFADYLRKLPNLNDEKEVFKGNNKFKFKRVAGDKVDLYNDGVITAITNITTEAIFYKSFYDTYHTNTTVIKSLLVTEDNLKIEYNTSSNTLQLEELYATVGEKKSDFNSIAYCSIKKTSDGTVKNYSVYIKNNLKEENYLLKFCNDKYECKITAPIGYDENNVAEFKSRIRNFIKTVLLDNGHDMSDDDLVLLYGKVKSHIEAKKKEEDNKEVMSMVQKADNPDVVFSGFAVLNESVKLKPVNKKGEEKDFVLEGASIRFFNNRINTLSIDGHVQDDPKGKVITFENLNNSIPFKYLNSHKGKRTYFLKTEIDGVLYKVDCDEILDYRHTGSENSNSVKNKSYELKPKENVKIEARNLFDYFTAIVFSDFLGVNDTGNNSLLMAEGRAVIPLEYTNRGNFNGPHYFEGYLNTSLYNGQEEGKNFVEWKSQAANGGNYDNIAMFEFYKKKNVEAGLNFGMFAIEWKGISTYIVFDYGVQFYRTRIRYIKDAFNTTEDFQVYSIGHGPKVKFEIRPQVNFGADLNIGFMGYNYNGINSSSNLNDELKHHVINDKPTFLNSFYILSNFYTKLNEKEKNNGLYFRLGGVYDFETSDVSPQLMVGYATNLSSFINKFKKKDEKAPEESK